MRIQAFFLSIFKHSPWFQPWGSNEKTMRIQAFFVSISNIARGFNHGNAMKKQSLSNPMFPWLKPWAIFI